jgi:hypothetical protein
MRVEGTGGLVSARRALKSPSVNSRKRPSASSSFAAAGVVPLFRGGGERGRSDLEFVEIDSEVLCEAVEKCGKSEGVEVSPKKM